MTKQILSFPGLAIVTILSLLFMVVLVSCSDPEQPDPEELVPPIENNPGVSDPPPEEEPRGGDPSGPGGGSPGSPGGGGSPGSPGGGGGGCCGGGGGGGGGGCSGNGSNGSGGHIDQTGSFVDSTYYNYNHDATDIPTVGSSNLKMTRYFRSRDLFLAGSFGQGIFGTPDYRLSMRIDQVPPPSSGEALLWAGQIHLRMPHISAPLNFKVDPTGSQPNNRLLPSQGYRAKVLEIFNQTMQPVNNTGTTSVPLYPGARYARLTDWDQKIWLFELVMTEPVSGWDSATHHPVGGRLVEYRDHNGRGYNISYKQWTQAQITESPSRQWQIDQIDDLHGRTLAVTYHSAQQVGNWVISQIVEQIGNASRTTQYGYTNGFLSSIVHPDGKQSSFTIVNMQEEEGPTIFNFVISDMAAEPGHRHKVVGVSGTLTDNGNGQLVPSIIGRTRMVRVKPDATGTLKPVYLSFGDMIMTGVGKLKKAPKWEPISGSDTFTPAQIYEDGWLLEVDEEAGTFEITGGALESQPHRLVTAPIPANTSGWSQRLDVRAGRQKSETTLSGVTLEYQYDEANNRIQTIYTDGTFEAYCHNASNLVTRQRDRLGRITRYTYDGQGRMLQKQEGLTEAAGTPTAAAAYLSGGHRCGTNDVQSAQYRQWTWTYHASGNGAGNVATETDPLGRVTSYVYNAQHQVSEITFPTDAGGPVLKRTYEYDNLGRLWKIKEPWDQSGTDPTVEYFYEGTTDRLISTLYKDGTTEKKEYFTQGTQAGLVSKEIDRKGVVTSYAYDGADRLKYSYAAQFIIIGNGPPQGTQVETSTWYYYKSGSKNPWLIRDNSAETEYTRDYRDRVISVKQKVREGVTLENTSVYKDNLLFSTSDPYGRKTYYGYDPVDKRLSKTIVGATPSYTLSNFAAVASATRDMSPNADHAITEQSYDAAGQLTAVTNPVGVVTQYQYDTLGRQVVQLSAVGTPVQARTETYFDLADRVTEVRSPRYFDTADVHGKDAAKETWVYNARDLVASHTQAGGTTQTVTETFTYDAKGRQVTHTDFRGKVWTTVYDNNCCDQSSASKNPLGHGDLRNADALQRVVHTAKVADVNDHTGNMLDPVNAKTLSESTTRYDARGRVMASTVWLSPRGVVDRNTPPIAGLDGIPLTDGLTTQYLYDDNVSDVSGLGASAGATPVVTIAGKVTSNISLSAAVAKLAQSEANGGAGITFNSGSSPGRARVAISPDGEISFTISDSLGRTVMSGQLDNDTGTPGVLMSWNCQVPDVAISAGNYGNLLESRTIDSFGKVTKTLTDSLGRTQQSIDQLGKITLMQYDAAGKLLSVRDPNGVGQDSQYDDLGRVTTTTDTAGHTTSSTYDRAGNRITSTDGKNQTTSHVYDALGRQKSQTDRLAGTTAFTYLATGQLASVTDAENQATSYTYDDTGFKLTEQYPDHTGGTAGSSTYGIVSFTPDAAGRIMRRQDQAGDTVTFNYDMAGRILSRAYRTLANSPSGTVADSDTMTYDPASRLLSAVSGRYSNTVTYTYDSSGRKKTEGLTIAGQTYTTTSEYNTRGELVKLTYPDGAVVERGYTDRGELYQIKHNGTVIDSRAYDDGGRMTGSSYNNSVGETRSYNNDNTLASISYSGASIGNMNYTWDANKNKTGESIAGTMSNYGFTIPTGGYDAEDRLVSYNRTSGLNQSWNLSLVGDWNSVTTNGTAQSRTHGPTHELTVGAGQNVASDVKGNMTTIPAALRPNAAGLTMTWDFDNRLNSAAVSGGATVSQQYDALGRRVARTVGSSTTVFVQDGQQTVADYAAGAAPASSTYRYLYASYVDEPVMRWQTAQSQAVYYHRNHQYSVVALTDASGAIVERYAYTAYGQPTFLTGSGTLLPDTAVANRYTYTGREWDGQVQLFHYRARTYDAGLGRFCSRDPIDDEDFEFSGTNLYEYVSGSSLTETDSTGLMVDSVTQALRICAEAPTPEKQIQCLETFISTGIDKKGILRQAINKIKYGKPKNRPRVGPKNPGRKGGKTCYCRCSTKGCLPSHCPEAYSFHYQDGKCNHTHQPRAVREANEWAGRLKCVGSNHGDPNCNKQGCSGGYGIKHCNCITR